MRKRIVFSMMLLASFHVVVAQVQQEFKANLWKPAVGKNPGNVISPGGSISFETKFETRDIPTRKMLRVIGRTLLPKPYSRRGETLFRASEYHLDDHLDSVNVKQDKYALYFEGDNDNYEQRAYYRVLGSEIASKEYDVELFLKATDLKIEPNGKFGLTLEVYYEKEGRMTGEVYDKADTTLYYPFPEGTYDFKKVHYKIALPKKPLTVLVNVGGEHFSGSCHVEAPIFTHRKKVLKKMPFVPFAERKDRINYWVGANLSSRSWPKWQLTYNGREVFNENLFDRSSNVADFYIHLPHDLERSTDPEVGVFELSLPGEPYKKTYPYLVRSIELIEETLRDVEIAVVPKFVAVGDTAGVLIEVNKPNTNVVVASADPAFMPVKKNYTFEDTGLHVIQFIAKQHSVNAKFTISYDTGSNDMKQLEGVIQQIIEKGDGQTVYLSSGDEVYVDMVPEMYDHFLKWYFRARVGNWYQFRPSYQWSGFRVADDKSVKKYVDLLNELHVPFAWQVEGRTLGGLKINPPNSVLESPMFRGKQAHENDGGYYYWQHFSYDGLWTDIRARYYPLGGIFAKHKPIYTSYGRFVHYDPHAVKDMAHGASSFVNNLRESRGESIRHTGPSTLFRYFFQAGYQWVGAEQMYGPEEIILSSLRGASRAYDQDNYGSLHAVQWGSHPFTAPVHALRLYMSLTLSYMHGSSEINTEEGLWTDEYMNDRYTKSGKEHLRAQTHLLDYVETHTRRGEMHVPIAIFQGRNCSWKSFGRTSIWSQKGRKWAFNNANKSFDLLNIFYPNNSVNWCGPNKWFSETPFGAIDIVPIEASSKVLSKYKCLVFLGWNSYDESDFVRLETFVQNGGKLILSAAHLNSELQPDVAPKFPQNDVAIKRLLGDNYRNFTTKQVITKGQGSIVYYPQNIYPIEQGIRADYRQEIMTEAQAIIDQEKIKGWITTNEKVGFTVWDSNRRRTLYLLHTDWASKNKDQLATLHVKGKDFPIKVRQHELETLTIEDGIVIHPLANTTDILDVVRRDHHWTIKVQTTMSDTIRIYDVDTGDIYEYRIKDAGIHTIDSERL